MPAVVFIGDAVSAAGWHLAGVQTLIAQPGQEADCLKQVFNSSAQLLLLNSETANNLPPTLLEKAQVSITPMVLVVPDMRGLAPMPDLMQRVHAQLGIGR